MKDKNISDDFSDIKVNNIIELKEGIGKLYSKVGKKVGLFWAFSKDQFLENKSFLENGDVYITIGGGGYLPKSKYQELQNEWEKIDLWYKNQLKVLNFKKDESILYELKNYECFYTGDVSEVVASFKGVYTKQEIMAVFNANKNLLANY